MFKNGRWTNNHAATNPQIPTFCSSNDFLNKLIGIRDKISISTPVSGSLIDNTDPPSTCTEQLQSLISIPQSELKLVVTSKSSTSLLDPIPTKLFKELLSLPCKPILQMMNPSRSSGLCPYIA